LREKTEIDDTFLDYHLFSASHYLIPWIVDFANYLASEIIPPNFSFHQRKKFMHDVKKLCMDEHYLYHSCVDGLICRCVPEVDMISILEGCHSSFVGWHHSCIRTAIKILQCGYGHQLTISLMSSPSYFIGANEME